MNESNEKLITDLDDEFKNQYEGDNKLLLDTLEIMVLKNNDIRSEMLQFEKEMRKIENKKMLLIDNKDERNFAIISRLVIDEIPKMLRQLIIRKWDETEWNETK